MSVNDDNRRPIAQRNTGWAKALTLWLARADVSPNTISMSSMVFAALAGACFYASGITTNAIDRVLLLVGAALFCQLRLLANMLDGMVAVEAGKGGADGPVWNELPDRLADIFILVGAGYGVAALGQAEASLGWAAAVASVMTAYVREVARGAGAPPDFSGPMAKPHRMFVMTVAALVSIFETFWAAPGQMIFWALWVVAVGATLTALNRTRRALWFLRRRLP
ncbi:CDP-diacylglycerol--glycerol-3-phosphate 3-phosphatidyltransferase [alpha proteobacterium U9-1i]|nr:CDP-diacylglycerol--glycerol-3-phosphate 3-phosphatidyltransferase [alpha proteobacterium U9-1i]